MHYLLLNKLNLLLLYFSDIIVHTKQQVQSVYNLAPSNTNMPYWSSKCLLVITIKIYVFSFCASVQRSRAIMSLFRLQNLYFIKVQPKQNRHFTDGKSQLDAYNLKYFESPCWIGKPCQSNFWVEVNSSFSLQNFKITWKQKKKMTPIRTSDGQNLSFLTQ